MSTELATAVAEKVQDEWRQPEEETDSVNTNQRFEK
jgi:hypothetical protein